MTNLRAKIEQAYPIHQSIGCTDGVRLSRTSSSETTSALTSATVCHTTRNPSGLSDIKAIAIHLQGVPPKCVRRSAMRTTHKQKMTDMPGAVNDTAHAIAIWKATDLKTGNVRGATRHQQILTTTHLLNQKSTMRG